VSDAVIFDLDGLLIDSEPIWRDVEQQVFNDLGVALTDELCRSTMGLPVNEVVAHWHERSPWAGHDLHAAEEAIVDGVIAAIRSCGSAMPGVDHALALAAGLGLRRGIASSSHEIVIDAALERLGLRDRFEVVVSAEHEPCGKPHPGVYLTAARLLGVDPEACVAIEDSPNGVLAAKAAGMRCVAVPEPGTSRSALSSADAVLTSLSDLAATHLLG